MNIDNETDVTFPLLIFPRDLANPKPLVASFSETHGLPKSKQRRLLRIVRDNIEFLEIKRSLGDNTLGDAHASYRSQLGTSGEFHTNFYLI